MTRPTDFTHDQDETSTSPSTDQGARLRHIQQGYQLVDGVASQVQGTGPQDGHQHGRGTSNHHLLASMDQPSRPGSRHTNSRPGSSMRPGSRGGVRSTMSRLSRSRTSRCSTVGSNRQRRHHLIVEALDGTKLAISYAWLSEWLADVASMPAGLRNKQVNTLLAGLPENILDVNPHTIHDLLRCLPAREAMRFKSMAVTTANYGTTTVTALDHTYIDFAIDHTFQRIEAQMQGLWAPSPEPGQEAGGHDTDMMPVTPPQQPVFMFLLEQFDAQVEAAIKIQRAFRQYRDRKGATKQSVHESTQKPKARYLDFRKDQHGRPMSREMDDLKQIFHNKLMDRMRSRASSRAGQDGRPALTEEEMNAIAERQAVRLVKQAAKDKRAAERLAEREARAKARELAKDARRETRMLRKLQGREVRLLGKLGRAKIRRVASLKKQLEAPESTDSKPTLDQPAAGRITPSAVDNQPSGMPTCVSPTLSTEHIANSEAAAATVEVVDADASAIMAAETATIEGSDGPQVNTLPNELPQAAAAQHVDSNDTAVCGNEQGTRQEDETAPHSESLSSHQRQEMTDSSDGMGFSEAALPPQQLAIGGAQAETSPESQQVAMLQPTEVGAGTAVDVPLPATDTSELQGLLGQDQIASSTWTPLTIQALQGMNADQATLLLDQLAAETKQQLKDLKSRKLAHTASRRKLHLSINASRQYRGSLTGSKQMAVKREPWALATPRGTTPTSRGPSMSGNMRVSFAGNNVPASPVTLTPRHRLAASTLSQRFSQQSHLGEVGMLHPGNAEMAYKEAAQNVAELEEKLVAIKHALTAFQGYVSSGAEDSGDDDVLSSQESSLSGSSGGSRGSSSDDDDDDSSISAWSLSDISDINAADIDRGHNHQPNNTHNYQSDVRSPSPESGSVIGVSTGRPASSGSVSNNGDVRSSLRSAAASPTPTAGLQGITLRTADPLKKAVFAGQSMQNEEHFYNLQRKPKKPPPLRLASVLGNAAGSPAGKQTITSHSLSGVPGPDMTSLDSMVNSPGRMQALILNKLNQGSDQLDSNPPLDNEHSADQLSGGLNSLDLTSGPHSSQVAFKSGLNLLHHMMFKDGLEVMEAVSKADTPEKMKEVLRAQVQQLVGERLLQIRHSLGLSAAKRSSVHGSAKPSPRSRSHSRAPSCAGSRSNTLARRSRCGWDYECLAIDMRSDGSPTGLLDRIADPDCNVDLSPSDNGGFQHTVFSANDQQQEILKDLITEALAEQLAGELSNKKPSVDGTGALGPVFGLQADASVEQIEAHIKDALQDKAAAAASKLALQRRKERVARRRARAKTQKAARVAAIGNEARVAAGSVDGRCSNGNWALKGTLMSAAVPRSPGTPSVSPSRQGPSRPSLFGDGAQQKAKDQAAAMAAHLAKLQKQAQRLASKPASNLSPCDGVSVRQAEDARGGSVESSPDGAGTGKQRFSATCVVTVGDKLGEHENMSLRASDADTCLWTPRRTALCSLPVSPRTIQAASLPEPETTSSFASPTAVVYAHEPEQQPPSLDLSPLALPDDATCNNEAPLVIHEATGSCGRVKQYDAVRARRLFLRHAKNGMALSTGHIPQLASMGEAADYLTAVELQKARSRCFASPNDAWTGFDMSQNSPSWSNAYIQTGAHPLLAAARDDLHNEISPAANGTCIDPSPSVQRAASSSPTNSVAQYLDQLPAVRATNSPSASSQSDLMRPSSRGLLLDKPIVPSRVPSPIAADNSGQRQASAEMPSSHQVTLPLIRSLRTGSEKRDHERAHRKARRPRPQPKDSNAIAEWINDAESAQAARMRGGQSVGDAGCVRTGHSMCSHTQAPHLSPHAVALDPPYKSQVVIGNASKTEKGGQAGMPHQEHTELNAYWSQQLQLPGMFLPSKRDNMQPTEPCKNLLWLHHTHGNMIGAMAKEATRKMPLVPH